MVSASNLRMCFQLKSMVYNFEVYLQKKFINLVQNFKIILVKENSIIIYTNNVINMLFLLQLFQFPTQCVLFKYEPYMFLNKLRTTSILFKRYKQLYVLGQVKNNVYLSYSKVMNNYVLGQVKKNDYIFLRTKDDT